MSIDKNHLSIYSKFYIAPVIPELNTCDKVESYFTKLCVNEPLHIDTPEQFKNETLPYSTEYCNWKIKMISREINQYEAHISLLQVNIIYKKVPGQIRKAQRIIKYLEEQIDMIGYRATRFYNGGISP